MIIEKGFKFATPLGFIWQVILAIEDECNIECEIAPEQYTTVRTIEILEGLNNGHYTIA